MSEKKDEALKLALDAIEKLWNIIDDIDTYGDMAKADEKLYRSLVERRQRTRFEETGISTDGHTLNGGAITAIREALAEQPAQQEPEPDRVKFERHWRKTRGDKKANRELPRHPLQPQTYIQDSANRHWVTWQAAVRSVSPQPAQQQEPVAWMWKDGTVTTDPDRADGTWAPLYTSPQPSKPLTDEEIWNLAANCLDSVAGRLQFARAIEAAHGIKGDE